MSKQSKNNHLSIDDIGYAAADILSIRYPAMEERQKIEFEEGLDDAHWLGLVAILQSVEMRTYWGDNVAGVAQNADSVLVFRKSGARPLEAARRTVSGAVA